MHVRVRARAVDLRRIQSRPRAARERGGAHCTTSRAETGGTRRATTTRAPRQAKMTTRREPSRPMAGRRSSRCTPMRASDAPTRARRTTRTGATPTRRSATGRECADDASEGDEHRDLESFLSSAQNSAEYQRLKGIYTIRPHTAICWGTFIGELEQTRTASKAQQSRRKVDRRAQWRCH